jgi:hypothetical protein
LIVFAITSNSSVLMSSVSVSFQRSSKLIRKDTYNQCWNEHCAFEAYEVDDWGSAPTRGRDLSYATATKLDLEPTQPLIQRVPRVLSTGVK